MCKLFFHLVALFFVASLLRALPIAEYGTASWEVQGRGNHRAVVESPNGAAVSVQIPWRLHDQEMSQPAVIVTDASGKVMPRSVVLSADDEQGVVAFAPDSGAGTYYCYYLPYTMKFTNFGDPGTYLAALPCRDAAWLKQARAVNLPAASCVRLEARSDFDRFDPMEVCATREEVKALLARQAPAPWLLLPKTAATPSACWTVCPSNG